MGDIDMSSAMKVCRKRGNESSHQLDPRGDVVLDSDDPMVPITPTSKCEGVDHCPSPLGIPEMGLLHCDYERKGGGFSNGECDSPSALALPNEELLDCDYKWRGGGFSKRGCDSLSPLLSSSNQELLRYDCGLKHGGIFSEGNPCTPKKDVFDPFAPGPEKLNLAPYRRKYTKELDISVVRKLRFDMCSKVSPKNEDLTVSEEEILFKSVYSDIMETIISTQTKEIGKVAYELPLPDECRSPIDTTKENRKVSCELPLSYGCRTPVGATRLSGAADTCPGAPVKTKSPHKFRRIDKRKCRKLDF